MIDSSLTLDRRTFLAGSLLGVGIVLAGCTSSADASGERTNDDGTKTYANRDFDFEVTYPAEWALDEESELDGGGVGVMIDAPITETDSGVFSLQAYESTSGGTWESVSESQLRAKSSNLPDYTVITRRDVTLGGGTPARIVDATFSRPDGTTDRHVWMNFPSGVGDLEYHVSFRATAELFETQRLAEIVYPVFLSFTVGPTE